MDNSDDGIKEFKSSAWRSKKSARNYAKAVNDRISLADIDLETQVRLLVANSKVGAKVLDVGCGTGALTLKLAKAGFEVTGVDISQSMLAQLAERAKGLNVKLVEADIFSLPFPDSCFDSAVSRWVLPHFSNWESALREVARVLKPGGVIVFDFPSREHVDYALFRKSLLSKEKLGYEHLEAGENVDPYFYYGAETTESIARGVSDNGLVFVSRTPYGLLVANSLVFGGLSPIESKLKDLVFSLGIGHSKTFRKVVSSIEREITPHLEARLIHGSFVVATKA